MKQKTIKRMMGVMLAVFLLFSISSLAFTSASAAESAGLTKVTDTVAVVLSSENIGANSTDHGFTAVKLMDLYKIDSVEETAYQYKLVLDETLATDPDFSTLLTNGGFKYDAETGEIKTADGAVIESQAGVNENQSDAAKLAALIAQYTVTKGISGTALAQLDQSYDLESGYYVIYETSNSKNDGTVATKPILLDLRPTDAAGNPVTQRNITLKDAAVSIDKNIITEVNEGTETLAKTDTVSMGDTVNFKIETNLPVYEANAATTFTNAKFEITDTLDTGLKLNIAPDNSFLTTYVNGTEYDSYESKTAADNTFTVAFSSDFILAHQGESVVLTYSATVTDAAKYNYANGIKNNAKVKYSNNPENSTDVKELGDSTTVYTYAFDIRKLDGADDSLLANAKFQMKNNDKIMYFKNEGNSYKYAGAVASLENVPTDFTAEIQSNATGDLSVIGLDEGVYTLTETSAPSGYAKLANPATVTVEALKDSENNLTGAAKIRVTNSVAVTDTTGDAEGNTKNTGVLGNSDVNVVLRNFKGISLPETGSLTSIIIMIAGAAVVICGVTYMLVSRKKREK